MIFFKYLLNFSILQFESLYFLIFGVYLIDVGSQLICQVFDSVLEMYDFIVKLLLAILEETLLLLLSFLCD